MGSRSVQLEPMCVPTRGMSHRTHERGLHAPISQIAFKGSTSPHGFRWRDPPALADHLWFCCTLPCFLPDCWHVSITVMGSAKVREAGDGKGDHTHGPQTAQEHTSGLPPMQIAITYILYAAQRRIKLGSLSSMGTDGWRDIAVCGFQSGNERVNKPLTLAASIIETVV